MLSGGDIVFLQIDIIISHANRYCVPMDDHRPISGGEKAFFSLGTGRGMFIFSFTEDI